MNALGSIQLSCVFIALAGCANPYSVAYLPVRNLPLDAVPSRRATRPPAEPTLEYATALDAATIDRYEERGYILTGISSLLKNCPVPDGEALQAGIAVAADLVVIHRPEIVGPVRRSIASLADCYLIHKRTSWQVVGFFDRYRFTLGVRLCNLGEDEKAKKRLQSGVLVCLVVRGSPADVSGLRVDDVLISIDGRAVSDTNSANQILARDRGMLVTILISRQGYLVSRVVHLDS